MEPQAPFSHSPLSELASLLQVMLLRELRELREGGGQRVECKLDALAADVFSLRQLVEDSHSAVMSNIDSEAKELRGIIKEIAAEPDQTQLVAKLKAFAAKLNAMAPPTPTP